MKVSHIGLLFGLFSLGGAIPSFASTSVCDAVSGNLVLNCGFELSSTLFTDWNVTDASSGSALGVTTNFPNSGTVNARFGASSGINDYIDQSFTTISGDTYNVSFYVSSTTNTQSVSSNGQFVAEWNGSAISTFVGTTVGAGCSSTPDSAGFDLCTFTETATGTSTDIMFGGNTKAGFYHLDDVVVTPDGPSPVPEPSSISFALAGLFSVFVVGRRYMQKRSE